MTDKITLELTLDELKLIDKYVELNDETNSVFDKIKDAYPKPQTLYDLIADWWDEIFMNDNEAAVTIESLVDDIEKWLPKEQSAAGSQNAYVESAVEGFNDCLTKIKGKLR
jgi:hypothetical protein